jgi:hypothetical protein
MKALFVVALLLLVGIAGVGFYQGWFRLSTNSTDQRPSATITVDKDKFHADEEKAEEKMQGLGHKGKEQNGDLTGKTSRSGESLH